MIGKIREGMNGLQVANLLDDNFKYLDNKVDVGIQEITEDVTNFKDNVNNTLDTQLNKYEEAIDKLVDDSIIAADEEDITSDKGFAKFADRAYDPDKFSGKGYKILRKKMYKGKNTLFLEDINEPNTVYEIRYDFDLNEQEITIPEGCILKFEGGSLSNGTLIGNFSSIESDPYLIFKNINIDGTFINKLSLAEWFGGDFSKCIESFNSLDLIGDYNIYNRIEINNIASINIHNNCNINILGEIDYLFYVNKIVLDSSRSAYNKTLTIFGSANIDLKNKCGFIYISENDSKYNIVIRDLKVINIGKGNNDISAGIISYINLRLINCYFSSKINVTGEYQKDNTVPESIIELHSTDNEFTNLTIVTPNTGISGITGSTILSSVHVWGSPLVAFSIDGDCIFDNCYGDFPRVHFLINSWNANISISNYFTVNTSVESNTHYQGKGTYLIKCRQTQNIRINATLLNRTSKMKYLVNLEEEDIQLSSVKITDIIEYDYEENKEFSITDYYPDATSDDYCYVKLFNVGLTRNCAIRCQFRQNNIIVNGILFIRNSGSRFQILSSYGLNGRPTIVIPEIIIEPYRGNTANVYIKLVKGLIFSYNKKDIWFSNRAYTAIYIGTYDYVYNLNEELLFDTSHTVSKLEISGEHSLTFNNISPFVFYDTKNKRLEFNTENGWLYSQYPALQLANNTNLNDYLDEEREYYAIGGNSISNSPTTQSFYFKVKKCGDTSKVLEIFEHKTGNLYIRRYNGETFESWKLILSDLNNGTFLQKPSNPNIGFAYFCTDKKTSEGSTNGIMIYYKGDSVWVDALGRIVE